MTMITKSETVTLPDTDGINVRSCAFYQDDDRVWSMVRTETWPLPTSVVQEFVDFLQVAINEFLTAKGIANGEMEKIPLAPPGSKVN